MSGAGNVVIRVDASPSMGLGHAMRCAVLAEALAEQGETVAFAGSGYPDALVKRLKRAGVLIREMRSGLDETPDADAMCALLADHDRPRVVVDHYGLGIRWEQSVRSACRRLVVIDDFPDRPHACDVLMDQTLGAASRQRGEVVPANCIQLLGSRYALLKKEFARVREAGGGPGETVRRVLVTLGGGDSLGPLGRIVDAMALLDDRELDVTVVFGPLAPVVDMPDIGPRHRLTVLRGVDDMAALMGQCDLIVSGGGSTCWESACLGIPMMLVPLAENQAGVVKALVDKGCAVDLGPVESRSAEAVATDLRQVMDDIEARRDMGEKGRNFVDGKGAIRVARAIGVGSLSLKSATADDIRLLYDWANDPEVRRAAFSEAAIPWEDHVRWFEGRLASSDCRIYIGVDDSGRPVGQVRFDRHESVWSVDVSIAPAFRGLGLAGPLLIGGVEVLQKEAVGGKSVRADVKRWNVRSSGAFVQAGFQQSNDGHDGDVVVFERELQG